MFENKTKTCSICNKSDRSEPNVTFYMRKAKNGKFYPSTYCKECERSKAKEAKKIRYHDPVKGQNMRESATLRASAPEYKKKVNIFQSHKYASNEVFRDSVKRKRKNDRADPVKGKKIRQRAAKYYQDNKLEIYSRSEAKKTTNPKLRLRGFMRGRINEVLRSASSSKGGAASLHYLSYTWDDLYRNVHSKFEEWMNFSNYGSSTDSTRTWNIDHIIPQSFFPYDTMDCDLFRWCWDLRNLRPLDSKTNFSDGNREDLLGPARDIRELFKEIREFGIPTSNSEPPDIIHGLLSKIPACTNVCEMSMTGLSYLDNIFTKRFESNTADFRSVLESMKDDITLLRVITHLVKKGRRVTPGAVFSNMKYISRTPGHFFPAAAVSVIKAHLPEGGSMFDPFLGWGGRTLGAVCSNVSRLVGCDLQSEVVSGCKTVASDFSKFGTKNVEFHNMDTIEFLKDTDEKFDLVFSSPPFMDTENYGVESDAMKLSWLDDFVFPFAVEMKRHLLPSGKVALHLKDLKGAATFTAYHSAMKSAGFKQQTVHRYGRTFTQSVYVYQL